MENRLMPRWSSVNTPAFSTRDTLAHDRAAVKHPDPCLRPASGLQTEYTSMDPRCAREPYSRNDKQDNAHSHNDSGSLRSDDIVRLPGRTLATP